MPDSKPRALVAEDTELGRWAVAHALAAEGFEVNTAGSRAETLGRLVGTTFAILVAAVSLEREDVSELIQQVKSNQPDTGLILLAGQNEFEAVKAACGTAAVVIEKPFSVDRIVEVACALAARPHVAMN